MFLVYHCKRLAYARCLLESSYPLALQQEIHKAHHWLDRSLYLSNHTKPLLNQLSRHYERR